MRKKRSPKLLLVTLVTGITLVCLVYFFPPTTAVSLAAVRLPIVLAFLILSAVFVYSIVTYIMRRNKHGFLVSIFVITYLIFRLNNLTHPFFLLLLLALLLTLELVFQGRAEIYTPHKRGHKLKSADSSGKVS